MEFLKKTVNIIGNILFYCFLAVMVAAIIMFACGIRLYVTMSGSMEPNIHTGSICFVNTKAEYSEIEEGDIIAFRTSLGDLVTHRAISITEEGMETKGDANENSDGISTTAENFHGETLFSVPLVGFVVVALQSPRNVLIVLVIAITILIIGHISDVEEAEQKAKKENAEMQEE